MPKIWKREKLWRGSRTERSPWSNFHCIEWTWHYFVGRRHSTEVAFMILTHLIWVWISPKHFLNDFLFVVLIERKSAGKTCALHRTRQSTTLLWQENNYVNSTPFMLHFWHSIYRRLLSVSSIAFKFHYMRAIIERLRDT